MRKATINTLMSVHSHVTTRFPLDWYLWNVIYEYFLKYSEKILVLLKSDKNYRYFTWRPINFRFSPCILTVSQFYYPTNALNYIKLLLLQSALQPLWVLACSTIVEYSQQEGFYRVPLPAARQTPQLGGPVIWLFQLPPPGVPHVWSDASEPQQRKVELWARNCQEFCRKWRLPRHFLGSFTCRKFTTWDRRLYFPSEGRRAEDFFARKIRRLRPGLNPRTRVPKASTLTSRPPKPLMCLILQSKILKIHFRVISLKY